MNTSPVRYPRWERLALVAVAAALWLTLFPLVLPLVRDFIAMPMAISGMALGGKRV